MTDPALVAKKLALIETCLSRNMAGFRNILVHGYDDVDVSVIRSILDHHLGDLAAFVTAVRSRLT